jgi:hypothetical protein
MDRKAVGYRALLGAVRIVSRRPAQTGSTLVESSIVLLIFLVVLIRILDMAQVMFFHHFLTMQVRSGARYAAVHTYNPGVIRNVVSYNSTSVPHSGVGLFGISPSMVQVNEYDQGTANARIEISVSTYSMHFLSPWLMRDFTARPFRAVIPVESAGNAQ